MTSEANIDLLDARCNIPVVDGRNAERFVEKDLRQVYVVL
jgi:hypothetical protein